MVKFVLDPASTREQLRFSLETGCSDTLALLGEWEGTNPYVSSKAGICLIRFITKEVRFNSISFINEDEVLATLKEYGIYSMLLSNPEMDSGVLRYVVDIKGDENE